MAENPYFQKIRELWKEGLVASQHLDRLYSIPGASLDEIRTREAQLDSIKNLLWENIECAKLIDKKSTINFFHSLKLLKIAQEEKSRKERETYSRRWLRMPYEEKFDGVSRIF